MNFIAYAGKAENMPERADKLYRVIIADGGGKYVYPQFELPYNKGELLVLPPLFKCESGLGGAYAVVLEKAILPFKLPEKICDDSGALAEAIMQAARFYGEDLPMKKDILSSLGNLIACYITAFSKRRKYSPLVETIRTEIEDNISDPAYSVDETLKRLPLSYEYLRKLFKKETGATPLNYLADCRMRLAAEIITSGISNQYSEYTVSQIAESCGFSDPMYFSRVFKKHFGVSPTVYGK